MADQFDLEQGIMGCWQVTSDLDVLFEELMENTSFTQDQASNFVLGLSTIYEAKFDKLFRTFESFLQQHYAVVRELKQAQEELLTLELEKADLDFANEQAAEAAAEEQAPMLSLQEIYEEEEQRLLEEEQRRQFDEDELELVLDRATVEDELRFK